MGGKEDVLHSVVAPHTTSPHHQSRIPASLPRCVSIPAEHHMSQEYSFFTFFFFKMSGNKTANPNLVTGQLQRIAKKKKIVLAQHKV